MQGPPTRGVFDERQLWGRVRARRSRPRRRSRARVRATVAGGPRRRPRRLHAADGSRRAGYPQALPALAGGRDRPRDRRASRRGREEYRRWLHRRVRDPVGRDPLCHGAPAGNPETRRRKGRRSGASSSAWASIGTRSSSTSTTSMGMASIPQFVCKRSRRPAESWSPPRSGDVLGDAPNLEVEDLGELSLKNLSRPVRAFLLVAAGVDRGATLDIFARPPGKAALPSIALLPFKSLTANVDDTVISRKDLSTTSSPRSATCKISWSSPAARRWRSAGARIDPIEVGERARRAVLRVGTGLQVRTAPAACRSSSRRRHRFGSMEREIRVSGSTRSSSCRTRSRSRSSGRSRRRCVRRRSNERFASRPRT